MVGQSEENHLSATEQVIATTSQVLGTDLSTEPTTTTGLSLQQEEGTTEDLPTPEPRPTPGALGTSNASTAENLITTREIVGADRRTGDRATGSTEATRTEDTTTNVVPTKTGPEHLST